MLVMVSEVFHNKNVTRAILFISLLLGVACTHRELIQDREYERSERFFYSHSYSEAESLYPKEKEENGFITTFEKVWISYWKDQQENNSPSHEDVKRNLDRIEVLKGLVRQVEERKVTKLTTEAGTFFFGEAEDGYNPSEHEILLLYLFLSMHYLQIQKPDEARIYLRRSADFLDGNPEGKENKFDSAAMRLWLAGLWSQLGEYDFAQVNLRVAHRLQPNPVIKEWLEREIKEKLQIHFMGSGPQVRWDTDSAMENFSFASTFENQNAVTAKTDEWFLWHRQRNTALREQMIKSNSKLHSIGMQSMRGIKKTSAVLISAPIYILSGVVFVGGTVLIASAATQAKTGQTEQLGYLFGGVFIVSKGIFLAAQETLTSMNRSSEEDYRREKERLKTYRMVRYLPAAIELTEDRSGNGWTWK